MIYARALTHAERAVALSPELGRAHEAAGMALWRGGRPVDALSAFDWRFATIPVTLSRTCGWDRFCWRPGARGSDDAISRYRRRQEPDAGRRVCRHRPCHVAARASGTKPKQRCERAERLEPGNPRIAQARAQLDAMKSKAGGRMSLAQARSRLNLANSAAPKRFVV